MAKIKGEGSLQKRNGSWRGVVSLGTDPITGKRRQQTRTFGKCSERQALRMLDEWIEELKSGIRADADKITFAEYSSDWQMHRERIGEIKRGTMQRDRSTLKRLREYLGNALLIELDTVTVKRMYDKMRKDGVSENCIHECHMKLKQILESSIDDEILLRNPCARIKVRKPKQKSERQSLSLSDAARLASTLDSYGISDSRVIGVRIGLATGARRGEILGLTWDDVDFENETLRIEKQLTAQGFIEQPKTKAGRRTIAIDSDTLRILSEWKAEQAARLGEELWIRQTGRTPIVTDEKGEHIDPNNYSRWFRGFCIENGFGRWVDDEGNALPPDRKDEQGIPIDENGRRYSRTNKKPKTQRHYVGLKFHELRHTQATLLIGSKCDIKTVQTRLGHSKASVTMDLYAHALPENDRAAASLMGDFLSESNSYQKVMNL